MRREISLTIMIDKQTFAALVRAKLPDAEIRFQDLTGTMDHLNVHIRSAAFAGQSLLDQHRLVYASVDEAMRDGRIHALQIRTEVRPN